MPFFPPQITEIFPDNITLQGLKALANAERAAKAKLEAAEAMLCCTCEAHEDTSSHRSRSE